MIVLIFIRANVSESLKFLLHSSYLRLLISCFTLSILQWLPELRRFAPNIPIVLVGTKLGKQQEAGHRECFYSVMLITLVV